MIIYFEFQEIVKKERKGNVCGVFFSFLYKFFLNDRISTIAYAIRKISFVTLIRTFIILLSVFKHFNLLKWIYIALIGICLGLS